MHIHSEAQLIRNPDLFGVQVDGEMVMLDEKAGIYFGLNPVAYKIWELLAQPITYRKLLDHLIESYDIVAEQCEKETLIFLENMLEYKLIKIINPS